MEYKTYENQLTHTGMSSKAMTPDLLKKECLTKTNLTVEWLIHR